MSFFNHRDKYDKNTEEYIKISKLLASDEIANPDLQLKITAFLSADVVVSSVLYLVWAFDRKIFGTKRNYALTIIVHFRPNWLHKFFLAESKCQML